MRAERNCLIYIDGRVSEVEATLINGNERVLGVQRD